MALTKERSVPLDDEPKLITDNPEFFFQNVENRILYLTFTTDMTPPDKTKIGAALLRYVAFERVDFGLKVWGWYHDGLASKIELLEGS